MKPCSPSHILWPQYCLAGGSSDSIALDELEGQSKSPGPDRLGVDKYATIHTKV